MAFDGNFVHALLSELEVLRRGKINRIQQIDETSLIFKVRSAGSNHHLLISAHPMYARFHLTGQKYEFPFEPPMFLRVARKHLEGGIIQEIRQLGNDRRVEIHIQSRNEIGDEIRRILILEIMGRHSNIIITDQDYRILDGIKHLTPNNNSRTIMPGVGYTAPPTEPKLNPRTEEIRSLPGLIDFNSGRINRQILNNTEGFSPLFLKEVEHNAGYFTIKNIVPAIQQTLSQAEDIRPVLYNRNDKEIFYFTPLSHLGEADETYDSLSGLLDDYYHDRYRKSLIRQKAQDYLQLIEREYDKVARKMDKLKDDLKEAEEKDKYQKYGELLTAYMHQVKPYDAALEVIDYYTNEPVTIPLDKHLSASDNAQKYYKRYSKLKARENSAGIQLDRAREDMEYLSNLLHQMDSITTEEEVDEIREELIEQGIIKNNRKQSKKKKQKIQLHAYTTSNGLDVLVGKNNKQNDYLTTRKAQNNHLWFHTKDLPGSHVVITRPAAEIKEQDILEAAMLAAYHSKAQDSESVPVDYTEIRHVHKVSGAKPGFVTYTDQKTVFVTPDRQKAAAMESGRTD
ncbi:fibronectin/fibrinogen-binding protein [Salinicoccus cyprini]|uniref:Rqc2 homolog RqcH n=1 Tax=Salinicoccus cyprini TaxID=2493691 RepID=A0A558AY16_9STAP|nr:NFACT RNA binding domain-containing protein [Salinicoccus cyprini]TVT29145.1 fibronectin/fibrinogen-binding protein [Salinicoccus cyprini]